LLATQALIVISALSLSVWIVVGLLWAESQITPAPQEIGDA
jgi:hypothetical protein